MAHTAEHETDERAAREAEPHRDEPTIGMAELLVELLTDAGRAVVRPGMPGPDRPGHETSSEGAPR
ncbi:MULTISPECIES: hypothetical protein [Kitasatospora]|uniref:hypothetical protein n=1 Tax=Kitasatospora TaxID=2063 RepID=UPI000C70FE15|nr:hypothetical protein [Kitasatospora sp. GP30]